MSRPARTVPYAHLNQADAHRGHAGSASVVYLLFGGVKWDYATLMIVTSMIVTAAGQMLTYDIIKRFGRRSIIIVAMAILLTVGGFIMSIQGIVRLSHAYPDKFLEHGAFCGDTAYRL